MSTSVDFEQTNVAAALEAITDEERHELDYGVVKLDEAGRVSFFSKKEAEDSGFKKRPALGRNFFAEIAPCMNSPAFKGALDLARMTGTVDIEIGWVGDFNDPNGEMRIRAVSASDGGLWILLNREAED